MTSTCSQRIQLLLLIGAFACTAIFAQGCKDDAQQTTPAPTTQTIGNDTGSTAEADPATETESEALRTVRAFQKAVLDLDLDGARQFVDETSPAYASVNAAIGALEGIKHPDIPDADRQMVVTIVTAPWRGADAQVVVEEGNSAIVSVTRSNGNAVDVNLNYFDGRWLINGPDNLVELR